MLKRDDRQKLSAEIDRKDGQIRLLRRKLDEANGSIRQISSDKAVIETKIENSMNRLASEYQMTYEYALENSNLEINEELKEEVGSLRKDISALGNINMDAPEQFTEDENNILNSGIDIDFQPPGKSVKSTRLFSGGEKTLIAICVLFTILKVKPVPLIVFDEVEAALDQANVERFVKHVRTFEKQSQFLIITHRPGTMAECDVLYGVTMQNRGISQMLKVKLVDAIDMAEQDDSTILEDKL